MSRRNSNLSRLLKPTASSKRRSKYKQDENTRSNAVERMRGRGRGSNKLGDDVSKRDLQLLTPRVGNQVREKMSARMVARHKPSNSKPAYVQSSIKKSTSSDDNSSVLCPYSAFGCQEEMANRDVLNHVLKSFNDHLKMSINANYVDSADLVSLMELCDEEFSSPENKDEDPSKYDEDYQMAMQYHTNGQYNEASSLLEALTVKGHPDAMYLLGCYCDWGLGYGRDIMLAQEYFQFAAVRGHAQAQLSLGACLYNGEGNDDVRYQAVYWFRKACELDNAEAQFLLGGCYELGDEVEQSWPRAYYWYATAGTNGHVDALHAAARCLQEGRLENPDDEMSATQEQLSQAACMFVYGAKKQHPPCLTQAGLCYELGKGVRQNYEKAAEYYADAAKLKDPRGTGCLAGCFLNGFGVERHVKKALQLFHVAADLGDAYSKQVVDEFAAIKQTK